MSETVRIAFEHRIVVLPLSTLLPLRTVPDAVKQTVKYRQIAKSIKEIGIIEPLVVCRSHQQQGRYLLLDGHIRQAILTELGEPNVRCLMADDDEAFTYNKRINRLATIQEHYMIVKAIQRGVSEEKLAKALDLDAKAIRRRRNILAGICPEVVELLKDKSINPSVFDTLRRMRPMRQIAAAEVMITAANFSSSYAKALLAATRPHDLVKPDRPKKIAGLSAEQMLRMEREMETLQHDVKTIEARYGDDMVHLVIAAGYLGKLLANKNIKRYLNDRYPEILGKFVSIVAAASLEEPSAPTTS